MALSPLNAISPIDGRYRSKVEALGNNLLAHIDQQWLLKRPIVDTELFYEQGAMTALGIALETVVDDDYEI